jgi:hypothetical protein
MIIGFSGKAQTGKTTCANHLASITGGVVLSFADQLRDEVENLFDIPQSLQRDPVMKANMLVKMGRRSMTLRECLQFWGMIRRQGNENYWVDRLLDRVGPGPTIIDDVRYRNEAQAIYSRGGILIRLNPHEQWEPITGSDHISETDLDDYSYFDAVYNPGYGQLTGVAEDVRSTFLR